MEREYDAVPKGDSLMRLAEDLFLFFKSVARGAFPPSFDIIAPFLTIVLNNL